MADVQDTFDDSSKISEFVDSEVADGQLRSVTISVDSGATSTNLLAGI